jgi:hypothetical protein
MKAILLLLAVVAIAESRYLEEELIETPWMFRKNLGRIFGGEPAEIANFPYMVALIDLQVGGFRCGGSIISSNFALSAARKLFYNLFILQK